MSNTHIRTAPSICSYSRTKTTELRGSRKFTRYYRRQIDLFFFLGLKKDHKVQSISSSTPLNKVTAALQIMPIQNHFNSMQYFSVVRRRSWDRVLKYFRFPHRPHVHFLPGKGFQHFLLKKVFSVGCPVHLCSTKVSCSGLETVYYIRLLYEERSWLSISWEKQE